MSKTITDYTAATGIDASNDYLLIEQSGPVYKSINRNTLLGLASAPVGLTDSQTLTNKTLTSPTISGPTFSGTLTGTYTIGGTPTFPSSVVQLTSTQTLTNKTLTSPTISGGTIDNATITVDSISGHSTSTIVTIANLQISNGVLNTNNSVVTANITDAAVTPAKLLAGTGSGWSWATWSPTFTGFTLGNGTVNYAKYIQIGKSVQYRLFVTLGSTSSFSGSLSFSLPVTGNSDFASNGTNAGTGILAHSGSTSRPALAWLTNATTAIVRSIDSSGSGISVTSTSPWTWGNGDTFNMMGMYEAA